MKIAVYYNLAYGGAKRVVQEQVKGLRQLKHQVDVYTQDRNHDMFDPGMFANNEYRYAYDPLEFKMPFVSRIATDAQQFTKLKNLHRRIAEDIDNGSYDVALIHTDTYTQSPFILRFLKTKNVYYCLEPLRIAYEYSLNISDNLSMLNKFYENINRSIRKSIDRTNARSANHTLALSYFGREYMIHAYNLYPQVVYLGVDESLFKPQKVKKKNQILFVAEREYIYGYDLAEAALQLIPAAVRPELKVVFGTKKSQRITDKELVRLYNESIVTLSLSRFDTFGLVTLESMSCSTPVIALNVAGYRETVADGETGFLVDFDPKEIAGKIEFLIKNPSKANEMGKQGRIIVEKKWTWKKQIAQLENYLKHI